MKVYPHPSPSPPLLHALTSTLPHSISLHYRTQHPNITPDAHILATFPPTASEIPKCWAAAYFDRSMRPETELWIFAVGEIPGHFVADGNEGLGFCQACKSAVLALVEYMAGLPIPPPHAERAGALEVAREHEKQHPQTGPDARYPPSRGLYMRHLLIPSVVSLGACHHQVMQLLSDVGLVREEFPGREAELNKFWFKISELPDTRTLPEELRWGEMREEDLKFVQARTEIPRAKSTLFSLKSVGVFERQTDRAIAWTFMGLDGSLTTLHTEPEYRGKGIAKAVAVKILKEHASGLAVDEQGNAWAHADVYEGNVQSESVCKSLGGKAAVKIFWVRIDIGKSGTSAA